MKLQTILNELLKVTTYTSLKQHYIILWVYTTLVFITSTIGHVVGGNEGFTYGMILGFVLSIILWYQYGRKMV
tara:strand:+ start:1786 stop:2004 length:219 start_codon:yes stop_codon:yes gene_type:complete